MIPRALEKELRAEAKAYPIVTVMGPRQSGKTTLVRNTFKRKPYVNLEAPDMRYLAESDPRGFLSEYPGGAILDEIQRVPELLSYIQVIVDETKTPGMFILTGSHQLQLHEAISQSLAGRTALLTLLPLSIAELNKSNLENKNKISDDGYLYQGFYPRIYDSDLNPTKAYRGYFQTYIERDVRLLINVKDLTTFQKFIKLCAGRIGQVLNMNGLSNEVGVSGHTIKHWLSILEASYVVVMLQPYFENLGKRVIKSPKLYFTDVGLATYLLDIENLTQIKRDPLRGNLFENMVVLELMKKRLNQGFDHKLYYYRDSQQNEVDVIYKTSNQLVPIEIKSSKTFNARFTKNLDFFENLVGERCPNKYLIYTGEQASKIKNTKILNYKNSHQVI